jgi:spoIIIJ-associated protein
VKELEISAKTVDDAVQAALEQLGVTADQVEVTVIKKGRSGVLGVGSEDAVVKVTLLEQPVDSSDAGALATEVLTKLIQTMHLDVKIKSAKNAEGDQPVSFDIDGEDSGLLIGRRGQTLSSLQYLVRLIVAEKMKTWVPISIDVGGYKKRRYDSLYELALRLAEQVKRNRRSMSLEPMPADERRIIHTALSSDPYITTQSMGEGEARKVVIQLKKR